MKVISMSELRKNIYAATRELPVEVQAKGKTLFYITESMFDDRKPEQPVLDQEQQIRMTVKMVLEELGTRVPENKPVEMVSMSPKNEPIQYSTMPPKIETPIIGWCQILKEYGVNQPIRQITWEDENGVAVVDKKWACDKCIAHYQNMGRGRVYFL